MRSFTRGSLDGFLFVSADLRPCAKYPPLLVKMLFSLAHLPAPHDPPSIEYDFVVLAWVTWRKQDNL
jgi:hypothetical protein